jgi:uncharacterized NAD(P)/FAD-binding protein YdhS
VHRHRVAPQIGAQLAAEIKDGKLETHAGRLVEYRESACRVDANFRERHTGQLRTLCVSRVINCTGPDSDFRRVHNALLREMLRRNLARTDSLFLGLDTAQDGALLSANGVASDRIYAIGPLRKGNLWESTAVPEIRAQAAELAARLIATTPRVRVVDVRQEHLSVASPIQ